MTNSRIIQDISSIFLFLIVFFLLTTQTWAGCSSYIGQATINEVADASSHNKDPFIEIKILDDAVGDAWKEWTLYLCSAAPAVKEPCVTLPVKTQTGNYPWVVTTAPPKYIDLSKGIEIRLMDENFDTVDYLSVAGHYPYPQNCFFNYATEFPSAVNNFFIGRVPDGTGAWGEVGDGANTSPTYEDNNDADASAACSGVFASALQNFTGGGSIVASSGVNHVISDPDGILETENPNFEGNLTCDGNDCLSFKDLSVPLAQPTFRESAGTEDVDLTEFDLDVDFSLGEDGRTDYNEITLGDRFVFWHYTLNDSGDSTEYHINTLNLGSYSEVNLRGGSDYWVDTLNFDGDHVEINVVGEGTARLFVKNSFSVTADAKINTNNGDDGASQLLIYAYDDLTIMDNSEVHGLIYSLGNVDLQDADVYGAVAAAGEIKLDGTAVYYSSDAAQNVELGLLCDASEEDVGVDHFEIIHEDSAIACIPEVITIRACANEDCTSLYTDGVSGTLTAGGNAKSFSIPAEASETKVYMYLPFDGTIDTDPQVVTLALQGLSVTPTNEYVCNNGATSCSVDVHKAGFSFDVPNLTAGVPSAPVTISAVYSSEGNSKVCTPLFGSGDRTVYFWGQYINPDTPVTGVEKSLQIDENDIETIKDTEVSSYTTSRSLNFTNGVASLPSVGYDDVGSMQLNARYDGSDEHEDTGLIVIGSDTFIVKPHHFKIDSITCSDGTSNPAASSSDGDKFCRSGEDFHFEISTRNADDELTHNYGREFIPETVRAEPELVLPAGKLNPELTTPVIVAFKNCAGVETDATFCVTTSWAEVGIIKLIPSVGDGDYLGAGDVTETPIEHVGRFYPHHFIVELDTAPSFANSCSSFTYMDQPFYYADAPVLTVTAMIKGGTDTTDPDHVTGNYGGEFWKLNTALSNRNYTDAREWLPSHAYLLHTVTQPVVPNGHFYRTIKKGDSGSVEPAWTTDGSEVNDVDVIWEDLGSVVSLGYNTSMGSVILSGTNNYDGSGTLTFDKKDELQYLRHIEESSFDATVDLTIPAADLSEPVDGDGVCYDPDGDGVCDDYIIPEIKGTKLRFGRLRLENANGSELLNLNVPIRAEYYEKGAFIFNEDDICTQLTLGSNASAIPFDLSKDADSDTGWKDADSDIDLVNTKTNAIGTTQGLGFSENDEILVPPYTFSTDSEFMNDPTELVLAASSPGSPNQNKDYTGYIFIRADLSVISWLQYDWDNEDGLSNGPYDDNPTARATFGIYKGNEHIIYIRETTWR